MNNNNNNQILDKLNQYMYYIIIGITSLIALCFLPMIGTGVGLAWNVPNTFVGWVVWITTKATIAVINVLIFHCFMQQAKINVQKNEKYIEAVNILSINNWSKEYIPKDPKSWNKKQYRSKGLSIFLSTTASTIALTQALLTFEWISMLTYLFTFVMGLIFGVMQMKTAENYWTEEFWKYAKMVEKDMEVAKEKSIEQGDDLVHSDRGDNILESTMDFSYLGNSNKSLVLDSSSSD